MRLKTILWKNLGFFVVLSFLCFNKADATHIMGFDLSYTCLGNNQYSVTLRFYRDCCGVAANPSETIEAYNACTNTSAGSFNLALQPGSGSEVSPLCPAQLSQTTCSVACPAQPTASPPTYPGVQVYIYKGTVTLTGVCNQWYFRYTNCCRNNSINNIAAGGGSSGIGVQALVNNTIDPTTGQPYCNSSVAFSSLPVPFECLNSDVTYNNGAVDVNGDSLVYSIIAPLDDSYNPIVFSPGWSASSPVRTTSGFHFNSSTGQISFTPQSQEVDVLAMEVKEYKNGVLVGSTIRDIQVTIFLCAIAIPAQNPITNIQNGNQVDSLTVQVCPGTPLHFDILCTDPANHNLTVTSNINTVPSAIPGATVTQIGSGDSVIARVAWTPLPGDTGCHDFVLTTTNNDCPINGSYTRVYTICVFTQVQLLSASPTYCGTPVQLTATGGSNYTWSPTAGLSNPASLTPTASPTVPTLYKFTSDCGTDSVFVNVNPPFTYDAGPGGNICQNGQLPLNATTDNLYAPYTFKWVPPNGLFDPTTGLPTDSVSNPVASPLTTTKYKVYVTGSNGCTNIDSLLVNIAGTGPVIVAKATPNNICPGQPVQLDIISNPQSCGISTTPCSGNTMQVQLGSGTGVTPTGSATSYPTIYGHYSNSARHQFLYTASELLALLGSGGEIRNIAFDIAQINSTNDTIKNFEIKMGCTQATQLNAWQPNLVTVLSPTNVPINSTTGWKVHTLDFPYNWDGTSNLVVDICFFNPSSNTVALNAKMHMTPTTVPMVYYSKGNNSQCGNTGTPLTSLNRPNTRFNVCINDISALPVVWTPNTGPNAPVPANVDSTTAHPQDPQIYHVNVTSPNGCVSTDFVYVNVDTSLRFSATPADTFFCSPAPVTLQSHTIGNPLPGQSFAYSWLNLNTNTVDGTGPTLSINPTTTTNYLVTLTGGACTLSDTLHIRVGNNLPINLLVDSITCFGANDGKIFASTTGGNPPITYTWNTGPGNRDSLTNLTPGTYIVSVSDAQGCSGTDSATLIQPTVLSLNGSSAQNILCNGANNGMITLTPTGGSQPYTYAWNPSQANAPVASGLSAGNYDIVVTDTHNCNVSIAFTISEPPALAVTVTPTNASCAVSHNGSAVANVTGGTTTSPYVYSWDGVTGTATQTGLDTGAHVLTVTDASNCTVTANFNIDTTYVLDVSATSTNASCFGVNDGTATVTTSNGTTPYTYAWTGGQSTANATALAANNYTVTVTDAASCSATATAVVTSPTQIVLSFTHVDPSCTGNANGSATVAATGGAGNYNYDWAYTPATTDNSTLNLIPSGDYDITVTDGTNCSVTGTVQLVNPPSLDAQFINKKEITCANAQDGSVEVSVSGGTPPIGYLWSNSSTSSAISNLAPGTYIVTVSDNNSCDTVMTVVFAAPPLISIASLNVDSVSCPQYTDGAIQIEGIGGTPGSSVAYEYSIDGSNFQSSELFSNLAAGTYHLYIRDGQGCMKDTTVTVIEPVKPELNILPQDSMIDLGRSITLRSDLTHYSSADINFYQWSPITGLSCSDCPVTIASPYIRTDYTLTVNYRGNCSVSQTVTVYVGNGDDVYIPNAFSPNGDGNNDVFAIYGTGLSKVNLRIFNRWGEKIFDSENQWLGWDGTYKAAPQEPSVYSYVAQVTYLNGKMKQKSGTVSLIR